MSEAEIDNRVIALQTVIGFGRQKERTCETCVYGAHEGDEKDLVCTIGEDTFGVSFPVKHHEFCEKHEVRR